MTLDEAIKHAEEKAKEQDKLCKRYDDASGYTRSHNKEIRTSSAKQCEKCADEHRQLAEWLKELKQLRDQTKWTPVSERLPKPGEYIGDVPKYYLVQNEYGDMLVARYTHGEYWEQIYQLKVLGDEIVAWMPLPEPYVPQESNDKCKNCEYYRNPDYARCHECKAESEG